MSLAGQPSDGGSRILVLAGGLVGAAGVALSAAAAHRGGAFTGTAASFLLMHAPVFLAIGLIGGSRYLRIASLLLFSGDLLARDFLGSRLFPMSAPIGGTLLIVGWLAIAISAQWRPGS
ncbi:MAG: DUF423 domain-containing protein [Mesorhizobium sp.]|uniref:DUF423 domain-containing protein n=1 Tax=Mesorhizobium sp. TaxID=1871066 RepID=UPI000FE9CCAC|nr:DUF423 domain-containing protein [Mesorhizobium sp.]RWH56351.1 MAG: DUF423 domain-containing protein [Mesorhizobium sp.]